MPLSCLRYSNGWEKKAHVPQRPKPLPSCLIWSSPTTSCASVLPTGLISILRTDQSCFHTWNSAFSLPQNFPWLAHSCHLGFNLSVTSSERPWLAIKSRVILPLFTVISVKLFCFLRLLLINKFIFISTTIM